MNEWTVVSVIVTLVGLGAALVRPLIGLNATITRLTVAVNVLETNISGLAAKNSESHTKLWDRVEEHDDILNAHGTRLAMIERR